MSPSGGYSLNASTLGNGHKIRPHVGLQVKIKSVWVVIQAPLIACSGAFAHITQSSSEVVSFRFLHVGLKVEFDSSFLTLETAADKV